MIQVREIRKAFGRVTAVRGLSFDAPDGAITGLLGPNGAGKTTTLRMIAGVVKPDAGTIRIGGSRPGGEVAGARPTIGALLDHHGLYARLTVRRASRVLRTAPRPA